MAMAVLIRSIFRIWDSPVVLAAIWIGVACSSVAVLSQHHMLAEVVGNACRAQGGLKSGSDGARGAGASAHPPDFGATVAPWRSQPMAEFLIQLPHEAPEVSAQHLALMTLLHIVENLRNHPGESRYSVIFKENEIFKKAVGYMPLSGQAMRALGFSDSASDEAWHFTSLPGTSASLEDAFADLKQAHGILMQEAHEEAEDTFGTR
eukprot:TRINITY_DN58350_c0_g1_i1.p1 TRINITY_DN58350_c0_g1~~TRINITY_DN58350_c0_g1_i1.p1  ORF type:complete len:206 (-),score=29.60 TRINITY_DN58350_c0_g1_i1:121-738(-)